MSSDGEKKPHGRKKEHVSVAGDFLFLRIVISCAKAPEFHQYGFCICFVKVCPSHAAFCCEPSNAHTRGVCVFLKRHHPMTPKTIAVAETVFRSYL